MRTIYFFTVLLTLNLFLLPEHAVAQRFIAIRGKVQDPLGRPVSGASVEAENQSDRRRTWTATTDEKGWFGMVGLSQGRWAFIIEAPGFEKKEERLYVRMTSFSPSFNFMLSPMQVELTGGLTKQIRDDLSTANALRDSGEFDGAITAYEKIVSANPRLTMVGLAIADTYRQKASEQNNLEGRIPLYNRAIDFYSRILQAEPTNHRTRIELAFTHLQKAELLQQLSDISSDN